MELILVMEFITLIVTLVVLLAGIPPCLHMYRSGDTKNVPFHIFLLAFLGAVGMLHYGVLVENKTVTFINSVGTVLQFLYICSFLLVVQNKGKYLLYFGLGVLYLLCLYSYVFSGELTQAEVTDVVGSASSFVVTVVLVLPVLEIYSNIRDKNADGVPPIMLLGGFVCGLCWFTFGIMLGDAKVYMPNVAGLMVNGAKLTVIQLYGNTSNKVKTT